MPLLSVQKVSAHFYQRLFLKSELINSVNNTASNKSLVIKYNEQADFLCSSMGKRTVELKFKDNTFYNGHTRQMTGEQGSGSEPWKRGNEKATEAKAMTRTAPDFTRAAPLEKAAPGRLGLSGLLQLDS